jgi:succinate dehydrogenase / fumarate reductase cytochrome b subunit
MGERMQHNRPVNLNFFTIHFPIAAIVSLLHRISGIFIALFIPVLLVLLKTSLESKQQWDSLGVFFKSPWVITALSMLMFGFVYHCIAGIRHLLMDIGIGNTKKGGRKGAILVLLMSIFLCLIWVIGLIV